MLSAGILVLIGDHAATAAVSQELQFRQLTPDHGLVSSRVHDILQDRDGFMWFGTAQGLSRYDGYTFANHQHRRADPKTLLNNYVNDVFEDRQGTLWVGTRGGMSRYDRARRVGQLHGR